jgi:hypothetical protein
MAAPIILTTPDFEALLVKMDKENAGQKIRMETRTKARAIQKSRDTLEPFASIFGTSTVWKITSSNYRVGCDYEKVVNAHRDREGKEKDFKSEGTYGIMETRTLLRKDDGSFQMRVFIDKDDVPVVRWVRDDGTELSPNLVSRLKAEFLPPRKDDGKKQEVEDVVKPRNLACESILGFRLAGVEYTMARV